MPYLHYATNVNLVCNKMSGMKIFKYLLTKVDILMNAAIRLARTFEEEKKLKPRGHEPLPGGKYSRRLPR